MLRIQRELQPLKEELKEVKGRVVGALPQIV